MCKHNLSGFQPCHPEYVRADNSSTDVNFIATQALARSQNSTRDDTNGHGGQAANAMTALEHQARAPQGFVAASTGLEGRHASSDSKALSTNPDALEVELDDD